MRANYDAIVIGSGFGGSVAACRLAQAGRSVAVFERGRRYDGNFPRNWSNPTDGWLWQVHQGLFDLKHFSHMMVIQGAGLGGGSLMYANVYVRAPRKSLPADGRTAIAARLSIPTTISSHICSISIRSRHQSTK